MVVDAARLTPASAVMSRTETFWKPCTREQPLGRRQHRALVAASVSGAGVVDGGVGSHGPAQATRRHP